MVFTIGVSHSSKWIRQQWKFIFIFRFTHSASRRRMAPEVEVLHLKTEKKKLFTTGWDDFKRRDQQQSEQFGHLILTSFKEK